MALGEEQRVEVVKVQDSLSVACHSKSSQHENICFSISICYLLRNDV